MRSTLVGLLTALAAAVGTGGACADDVRVLATGVFAGSLRDLHAAFEAESGGDYLVAVGNAGQVRAKLVAGERADVVMTSSAGLDALVREGRLDGASRIEVGRMRLGLAVPAR